MKLNKILIKTAIVLFSLLICLIAVELFLRFQHKEEKSKLINKYKELDSSNDHI